MRKIGYMRVSTDKQDHSLQRDALTGYGCTELFQDTISGSTRSREGLDTCLATLEAGDTLVVWKLDRLGRTARNLHNLVGDLSDRKIGFVSLTEGMDSSTMMGRAMFCMMVSFAQMERDMIQMRVRAGLDAARAKGKKLGPKFKITGEQVEDILKLSQGGLSQKDIANHSGISQPTVSRILGRIITE